MRYEGVTVKGARVALGQPITVRMTSSEDSPADVFTGVFPGGADCPDLLYWNVYDDDDTLLFGGIVDRQKKDCSGEGILLTIEARSKAALLLDNEAMPQTYINPSLGTLFQNHGAPYGLPKFLGKTASYYWTYVIPKGTSEWQVFWDFCLYCIGIEPRVTPEGVLDVTGQSTGEPVVFSNAGGIPYSGVTHDRQPKQRLSGLHLQGAVGEGYQNELLDLIAIGKGIRRNRYVTAANWQGRRMLKTARRKSDSVILTCPKPVRCPLGTRATVDDPSLGRLENYRVSGLVYTLDHTGETWTVTLQTEV